MVFRVKGLAAAFPLGGRFMAAKILLVDDHPIVRRGLREILAGEPDMSVCGEAGTVGEALRRVDEQKPDLIVVDLSLDEVGGLELIKQVKATHKDIKMLVASMHDERIYAERALHAGALGYINKDEATDHLVAAIRQVLSGKVFLSEEMTERVLNRARAGGKEQPSPMDALTDREMIVFELFGQGLTTRQIAERLHRSIKTIETHRDSIKSKLGIDTAVELIHRATLWVRESRG